MGTHYRPNFSSNSILLLQVDRKRTAAANLAQFDEAPFQSTSRPATVPARSRFIDDAENWATWRAGRLGLEQELAVHEACNSLDSDHADRLRDRLVEIERRVCDSRVEEVLGELDTLQRQIQTVSGTSGR